jgi:cysteine synthase A
MNDPARYYILGAFVLGAVLATALNEQFTSQEDTGSKAELKRQQKLISRFSKTKDLDTSKKSLVELESSLENGAGTIKEGIEGCIGDTPLIKIKSLSEYTGCEILAKAEVCKTATFIVLVC